MKPSSIKKPPARSTAHPPVKQSPAAGSGRGSAPPAVFPNQALSATGAAPLSFLYARSAIEKFWTPTLSSDSVIFISWLCPILSFQERPTAGLNILFFSEYLHQEEKRREFLPRCCGLPLRQSTQAIVRHRA